MNKTDENILNVLNHLKEQKTNIVIHTILSENGLNPYTKNALENLNLIEKVGNTFNYIGNVPVEELYESVNRETKKIMETRKNLREIKDKIEKTDTIKNSSSRTNAFNTNLKIEPERTSDDVNDYPTPIEFVDLIFDIIKNIDPSIVRDDFMDLCCNSKNIKFNKGFTLNGSIGIYPPLEGNSLDHDWHKYGKFGWLASPYCKEGSPQRNFSEKAVKEAKNGMFIIGIFQSNSDTDWYQDNIIYNPNCVYVQLRHRFKYPNTKSHPSYGITIVLFGINEISLKDRLSFSNLIDEYNKNRKKLVESDDYWFDLL